MRLNRANERRGVILLVVLSLLTLFAIVGITFVLYADGEATASRVAREAETAQRADMEPEQALAMFLSQFIYDVPDTTAAGVGSGLRGHSLARTMYGYNNAMPNIIPFSGVGRLHYPSQFGQDDYTLVNYTWFSGDNFLRDPERFGTRANIAAPQGYYAGGNAPYTYPDLNNFFLAAVNASGQVLVPSFHRPWLFNPGMAFNNMANPNWTNAQGKYMTLRPRPAEHPNFPAPDDAFGDVKQLVWAPGGNDSIWIDIGAPVMTAPDGTQYKMLVAPLIMDLDGRINLGTAGNILGPGNSHVSNQGFGGWEVNLAKVLYGDNAAAPVEYKNLILGKPTGAGNTVWGKYGMNGTPSTPGANAPSGTPAHSYAPGDVNGLDETAPPYSTRPIPPGIAPNNGLTPPNPFALFQQGYLSGGTELTNHPLLYNLFRPAWYNNTDDRIFRPGDMEPLLRPNMLTNPSPVDAGSSALISDLIRLCPANFGPSASSPRFRNMVTTYSNDLGVPGVSPYWYNSMAPTAYLTMNPNPLLAPLAATPAIFPTLPPTATITSSTGPSEFGPDWRAISANPANYATNNPFLYMSPGGRIRLNRPLPPYPHMGAGATPPYTNQPPNNPSPYGVAYNLTQAPIVAQFTAAQNARQSLANDIYRRLLILTGVAPPAGGAATPTNTDLAPRRWLAQLAVNIVDFIDEDDISTPFNFYSTQDGLPAANIGATQGGDDNSVVMAAPQTGANPTYWVFGTELPKVVLNEVLAEAVNPNPAVAAAATENVKVWLELFNTMPTAIAPNTQPQDTFRVPLYVTNPAGGGYSPYRITIAQTLMNQPPPTFTVPNAMLPGSLPDTSANVLGKAFAAGPLPQSTTDADFAAPIPLIGGGNQVAVTPPGGVALNAGVDPQGYFLIGPPAPGATYEDPFVAAAGMTPGVPATTPTLRTLNVTYTPTAVTWPAGGTTDERITGLTVLLRRLANPYLPLQVNPALPYYNPYVTVDYVQNVPIQSNNTLPAVYSSRGKTQPYAGLTQVATVGVVPQAPAGSGTLATSPVQNQQVNAAGAPTAIVIPAAQITHSFGMPNFPLPPSGHYDWLVHLDRLAISPMELLHVSAYQPYQLTQQFMLGADNNPASMFGHYAPWLDGPYPAPIATLACPWWFDNTLTAGQSHRLYRLFEFLECGDWFTGVNGLGRIPGKVNINTIWDAEILQALIDANPSMGLPATASGSADTIATMFGNLMTMRSPSGLAGPTGVTDRPFQPLSVGFNPPGGTQFPTLGTGVTTDTLLRMSPTNAQLLFQNPGDTSAIHPYLQTQLLTKLYNNVTTRSNTFAVFLTVGFFTVEPGGAINNPNVPRLGAEIGRSEGRQVRHRMFAIVDRTNLAAFSTTSGSAVPGPTINPATPSAAFGNATITVASTGPIGPGTSLVIEPGTANEETVIAQTVNPMTGQITANFLKQHPNPAITGNPSGTYSVILRGNPGPQMTRYDPRLDSAVVPYFSIID